LPRSGVLIVLIEAFVVLAPVRAPVRHTVETITEGPANVAELRVCLPGVALPAEALDRAKAERHLVALVPCDVIDLIRHGHDTTPEARLAERLCAQLLRSTSTPVSTPIPDPRIIIGTGALTAHIGSPPG